MTPTSLVPAADVAVRLDAFAASTLDVAAVIIESLNAPAHVTATASNKTAVIA